jgi:queuine tRNA-ribosyltransferase
MFKLKATEGMARVGVLKTGHGRVDTPSFKAVATKGAVKLITPEELHEMGAQEIISNAFILSLRPGLEVIEAHGGLHKFIGWDGTIFTDCGGFQVLSLEENFHQKTTDEGLEFKSPFDGIKHVLTPTKIMDIQNRLDSDIAMALDHMPLYGCTKEEAAESVRHTNNWMAECLKLHNNKKQLLFGIAQGSVYPNLRKKSIKYIDSLDFDGIAYGGLAVGEPKDKMLKMIKLSTENCTPDKPHYLMGVGNPIDLVECINLGVDSFDSVFPTRNARHGQLFTRDGPINIRNGKFRHDYGPIDTNCKCVVCSKYTRSYMHHLHRTGEPLGLRLASYHNLFFIQQLLKDIRKAISQQGFGEFRKEFLKKYHLKNGPKPV